MTPHPTARKLRLLPALLKVRHRRERMHRFAERTPRKIEPPRVQHAPDPRERDQIQRHLLRAIRGFWSVIQRGLLTQRCQQGVAILRVSRMLLWRQG